MCSENVIHVLVDIENTQANCYDMDFCISFLFIINVFLIMIMVIVIVFVVVVKHRYHSVVRKTIIGSCLTASHWRCCEIESESASKLYHAPWCSLLNTQRKGWWSWELERAREIVVLSSYFWPRFITATRVSFIKAKQNKISNGDCSTLLKLDFFGNGMLDKVVLVPDF